MLRCFGLTWECCKEFLYYFAKIVGAVNMLLVHCFQARRQMQRTDVILQLRLALKGKRSKCNF